MKRLVLAVGAVGSLGGAWAVEVLTLPDGSWIGPPVVVEAKPVPPRAVLPLENYRSIEPCFEAKIGEDKTLLRQLYEVLPAALQKSVKSPPKAPKTTTYSGPVDKVLVFPTGGGWPVRDSRYFYAFADQDGNIGEATSRVMERHVGGLAYLPAVLPKRSAKVTLMAWEKGEDEYRPNFSKPPVAKMAFANPLFSANPPATLWPESKVERERTWRGRTLRLERASRVLHDMEDSDRKKRSAGIDFDFVLEGARTPRDLGWVDWFLEDNWGRFFMPDSKSSSWGSNSSKVNIGYTSSNVAFWPENLNWRLTLVLRPSNLAVMDEKEYRRVRIQHPKGRVEETMVDEGFEINGVNFKSLRISTDTKPPKYRQPEIEQWYVPAVIEFEVENAPPDVFIELGYFYDGFIPFEHRPNEIGQPKPDLGNKNKNIGRIPVALDKQADFLEFVISVTREERLEFYFQPELLP